MSVLRRLARRLPAPVRDLLAIVYGRMKVRRAFKALAREVRGPEFLNVSELEALMRSGRYREPDKVRYDTEGLEIRAVEKIDWMSKRLPLDRVRACLELGCNDGMVLAKLAERGIRSVGLDLQTEHFDARARRAKAEIVSGDASNTPFSDASFDLVCSFAAFEHFTDPDGALSESLRVLRPGGWFCMLFTPIYSSPFGRHCYRDIPVPFCHYLFSEQDLLGYAKSHGLGTDWPYVNGWRLSDYRRLWRKYADKFDEGHYYREGPTGGIGAELVARWPACFRGRVEDPRDLFVAGIELAWRKK